MINLKTIAAGAAITGGLAFTAVGLGTGIANADVPSPHPAAVTSQLNGFAQDWGGPGYGWGGGPGYGGWGGGPGYGGWGGGPGYGGWGGGPGNNWAGAPGYGWGGGGCGGLIPPVVSEFIPPALCGGGY